MKYRLREFLREGQSCHLARLDYRRGQTCPTHHHDYSELFFIETGTGLHDINGQTQTLVAGDMVLIRPQDCHAFRTPRGKAFTMVNLAFHTRVVRHIRRRYFNDDPDWCGAGHHLPAHWRLGETDLRQVSDWSRPLSLRGQRCIDLESFLLNVFGLVTHRGDTVEDVQPAWLIAAIDEFVDQGKYVGGVAALVDLAGKSPEHVNRTVRHCRGQTTTELVNTLRLDQAAHLLRMTDHPIVQVAMSCGFDNLGYFYRRFKDRFATTPRRFRTGAHALAKQRASRGEADST